MKAAAFDYVRAGSIDEVCRLLADGEREARLIAGGQTLIPLMAMRMARPELLVDINHVAELRGIRLDGDALVIGACTRQAAVLSDPLVAQHLPLLAEALSHVGHVQTRNRGTIGGSLANADPTAEICLVARTLDARIVARSSAGERTIPAAAFFESAMMTTLAPEECLIEVRFPIWREGRVAHGFHEVGIRHGDFAIAAAAAQLVLDGDGNCARLALALGGASPCPLRLEPVEQALTGTALDDAAVDRATQDIAGMLDPQSDIHASAEQRRRSACVMARRAVLTARDRALKETR
jgi:CO/xanthine dehydrogenase FAD-binding subunit